MSTAEADSSPSSLPPPSRALRLVHAAWGMAGALAIATLIASLPGYAVWLQGENPLILRPNPASPFNVLSGLTSFAVVLICFALAFLLFVRKRSEAMALFVSFYVMVYGVVLAGPLKCMQVLIPAVSELDTNAIQDLFLTAPTMALIVLFPNGRAVPRWSRWLIVLTALLLGLLPFVDTRFIGGGFTLTAQVMAGCLLVLFGLAAAAQVFRYRSVSTPAEREQTRWVVFGLTVWLALLVVESIPFAYLQSLPAGEPQPGWAPASYTLGLISLAIVPVTLTIAILRYRLYNIDLIINRTLVYGALTAILAGLYSASISLLQKLFVAFTGEKSDAAIVLTTLLLTVTFTPIRTRLQALVDRRFRDVHDPLRCLTDFARRLDTGVWVVDRRLALARLLDEALDAFDAAGGVAYLREGDSERAIATAGAWEGQAALEVPVMANGTAFGRVAIGPRRKRVAYSEEDRQALAAAADAVARAVVNETS